MIYITQPTYMPWIGYFSYLLKCKKVVFLDDVQFSRKSWQQRNKIFKETGFQYLTVPVEKKGKYDQKVNEVMVKNINFFDDHLKIIKHTYSKSFFFNDIFNQITEIRDSITNEKNLSKINIIIINKFLEIIGKKINYTTSSEIDVAGKKSQKLINICLALKAKKLMSNEGAKIYLNQDINLFKENKIDLSFYKYNPIKYNQLGKQFTPYLSIIDLLFNEGPKSSQIIDDGLELLD